MKKGWDEVDKTDNQYCYLSQNKLPARWLVFVCRKKCWRQVGESVM